MNREQISQLSFDCVLPSAIFFNQNLEPNAIKLYAMIRNLAKMEGYCYATNEYLKELLGFEIRAIQYWLASLRKEGYIDIETSKNGIHWQRRIFISDRFKKCLRSAFSCTPPCTNLHPPMQNGAPIKEEYSKEEYSKEKSKPKDETPASAVALADSILERIKRKNPEFSKKVSDSWKKDSQKILKLRSHDRIMYVLDYAMNDDFWCNKVLCPGKLLKHLDALEMQITNKLGNSWNQKITSKDYRHTSSDRSMPGLVLVPLSSVMDTRDCFNRG